MLCMTSLHQLTHVFRASGQRMRAHAEELGKSFRFVELLVVQNRHHGDVNARVEKERLKLLT